MGRSKKSKAGSRMEALAAALDALNGGGPREPPADAGRGATSADNGRFRHPALYPSYAPDRGRDSQRQSVCRRQRRSVLWYRRQHLVGRRVHRHERVIAARGHTRPTALRLNRGWSNSDSPRIFIGLDDVAHREVALIRTTRQPLLTAVTRKVKIATGTRNMRLREK